MKNINYNQEADSRFRENDSGNLHKQFVKLGRQRNQLTYQLLALLPEINNKKIYLKHGCNSIVEYAGKFGGLSREVVKKALKVHKDVEDKPHLKAAIEKVGIHKVGIISGAATKENEKVLAETIQNAPTKTVQMLSKEIRNSGCKQADYGELIPCQAAPTKMSIDLDEEMQFRFLKLKKKFGEDLSNREALRKMLNELVEYKQGGEIQKSGSHKNRHEQKLATTNRNTKQQNSKIVQNFCVEIRDKNIETLQSDNSPKKLITKSIEKNSKNRNQKTVSRYIPVNIRKKALAETNGKCSYPGCNKPAELFHHRGRFAETKNHSSVIPLCKCHHDYAHNGLIINEQKDTKYWHLAIPWSGVQTTIKPKKGYADTFYLLYKQGAL